MATGVAQTLTPAIGVAVAEAWGFDAVFVIAAATAGLTLLVSEPVHEPEAHAEAHAAGGTLLPRPALFPMSVFMTVTFSFAATASFLPLLGEERGLGNVGLFFLVSGAIAVVVRPIAGAASDRVGRVPVVVPGLAGTVVAMWLLAAANGPAMLWAAGVAAGIGLAAAHTALLALAIDRVDDRERGRAAAVLQLAWDVSGIAGGVVLGVIASLVSVPAVYWFAGVLVIGGGVWLLIGEGARTSRRRAELAAEPAGAPLEAARREERSG
jgi:MFS family permease